jgi:hypothetical protein
VNTFANLLPTLNPYILQHYRHQDGKLRLSSSIHLPPASDKAQFNAGYYEGDDPMAMYNMLQGRGAMGQGAAKRFDEFYRCYPTVMLPGAEREYLNYGGKIIMPPSALDKLSKLRVTYPMLFELINGKKEKVTHAGVLEFVAEEGKAYLPHWVNPSLRLDVYQETDINVDDENSWTRHWRSRAS